MAHGSLGSIVGHIRRLLDPTQIDGQSDGCLLDRFASQRDEAAFAALVRRHGPMVLSLCRRLVHDSHAAEDAFQATFLVLVRKTPAIRKRDSVGSWLYGVAYRLALRARTAARRRQAGLKEVEDMPAPESRDTGDLRPVLDEEINRLPEKYRSPVVLCYLEGKTAEEAAGELGWPKGTVFTRLSHARKRLRERLERRGVGLVSAATALAERAPAAPLTPALLGTTVQAALTFADGQAGGALSSSAVVLAEGGLRAMRLAPWKVAAVLLLALGALGAGAAALVHPTERPPTLAAVADQPEATPPDKRAAPPNEAAPLPDESAVALRELAPSRRLGPREHFDHAGLSTFAIAGECRNTLVSVAGNTVRVWDANSGQLNCEFDPKIGRIGSLLLDGMDGNAYTMVAASRTKPTIVVWPVPDRGASPQKPAKEYGAGEEGVAVLRATGDGLAAGAVAHNGKAVIRLWGTPWVWSALHPGAVKLRRTFEGHTGTIAALSSHGDWLASAAEDGTVRLWQLSTGKELRKWPHAAVADLAFSPQGRFLAVAADRSIRVLEMPEGKEVLQINGPGGRVTSLGFTKDCATLAAADDGQTLIKWKLARQRTDGTWSNDPEKTDDLRPRLKAEEIGRIAGGGRQLVINAYGELFATACAGRLRRWQPTDKLAEVIPDRGEYQTGVTALAFTADGKALVTQAGGITHWDLATGRPLRRWQPAAGFLTFTPDSRHLVRRGDGQTIRLVDLASGQEVQKFSGTSVVFAPGGKHMLVRGESPARIYEAATGNEVASLPGIGERCALSPDGRFVAQQGMAIMVPEGPNAHLKDPGYRFWVSLLDRKGQEVWRRDGGPSVGLMFSPDGRTLAAGPALLEVETGKVRAETGANVPHLAFSPDGRLLAAAGDNTVHVFSTATGKERFRLTGHEAEITCLAFSPDGRMLASGSQDTSVLLWNLGK